MNKIIIQTNLFLYDDHDICTKSTLLNDFLVINSFLKVNFAMVPSNVLNNKNYSMLLQNKAV